MNALVDSTPSRLLGQLTNEATRAILTAVRSLWHCRLVALAATLAVAGLGLLPGAHVHANEAGATVHRHAAAAPEVHHHGVAGHHGDQFGPGDHAPARTLPDEYVAAAVFALIGPEGEARVLDPPVRRVARRPHLASHLPTHDPPLRYVSSPAPPLAS